MDREVKNASVRPIIFWEGLPVCGLLMKQVSDVFGENLVITATRSATTFQALESVLGRKIIWLDDADDIWKRKDEFGDRNLIIHTGWTHKGWLKYDQQMKKRFGAKTVIMVDNRFRKNLRQRIGAVYFRLCLKKYFDGAFVPGKEGRQLMRFLGMDSNRIYTGIYGAYEGIFKETNPIENRENEFLFVGQLIERKAVDVLIESFSKYRREGGKWDLRIIGDGPLENICKGDGIILEDFAQPDIVAQKMNQAKVLVLPSRDDNWGTVVCEAAACGMQIISTKTAGASADIIQNGKNGIVLDAINADELKKVFLYFENLSEDSLKEGSKISKDIASRYGSRAYYRSFMKIVADFFS